MSASSSSNAGEPITRTIETVLSIASSRVVAGGDSSAVSARCVAWPTAGSPVLDMIDVSDRTRAGDSIATVWAIMPPIDAPTRCALSSSRWSSSPTVSAAMSESR